MNNNKISSEPTSMYLENLLNEIDLDFQCVESNSLMGYSVIKVEETSQLIENTLLLNIIKLANKDVRRLKELLKQSTNNNTSTHKEPATFHERYTFLNKCLNETNKKYNSNATMNITQE